jgi:hypothetical protein
MLTHRSFMDIHYLFKEYKHFEAALAQDIPFQVECTTGEIAEVK